ncbi:sigma 54-interacting transcriptional regulator [Pendulispora brunnea]|uniref:Sigma 54-interacting transcriptional regulator n=1 Tax=Pendulispora brunnea TaxID=2905690 RepID=A0ABZ2K0U3_9BACT
MTDRSKGSTITVLRSNTIEVPALRVAIVDEGPEVSVPLGLEPVTIGSSDECQLVLRDRRVSRRHCSITLGDDGVVLRDLASKNGTFLGEIAVREAVLVPEVIFTVGMTRLAVRVVGAPAVLELHPTPQFGEALGGSLVMRALFARLAEAAQSDETILLLGESGTGKELLARGIHDMSPRRDGPFVVMDGGSISPNLIEAELFGNVRGAFTGAVDARVGLLQHADGGTLFLDEIGELPLDVQPKLLRALEARQFRAVGSNKWQPFHARIVAATHRDLRAAVRDGTFRSDLYYRLAVIEARVPPLRERKDDLELLVDRFLASQTPPLTRHDLPKTTMAMLRSHSFPGNVRELRNVLTRLALFPRLGLDALEPIRKRTLDPGAHDNDAEGWSQLFDLPLREAREHLVERFESSYLEAKLKDHAGNVGRTAQSAGVSRQMIYRLLERYGLRPGEV